MKRFFREMKRMDKWILDSLHIHRSVHLAKGTVRSSCRRRTSDVPYGGNP